VKKLLFTTTAVLALSASAFAFECLGPTDIQKAIDTYHQNEIRFVRDFKGKQIAFTWNFKRANTFGDHVSVDFGGGIVKLLVAISTKRPKNLWWNGTGVNGPVWKAQ